MGNDSGGEQEAACFTTARLRSRYTLSSFVGSGISRLPVRVCVGLWLTPQTTMYIWCAWMSAGRRVEAMSGLHGRQTRELETLHDIPNMTRLIVCVSVVGLFDEIEYCIVYNRSSPLCLWPRC